MRIDWQKVRQESGGGELVLLALPRDGVRLLLSILEPLEWRATFRFGGYDFSDWDALQAVVAETQLGLMEHELLSTIVDALEKLTTAVENLSIAACCVNPVSVSSPNTPLIGSGSGSIYDAPTPSEPPPYPFEVQSWSDYRCRAGEFVYQRLRALAENVDVVLSVTGSGVIAASVVILGLVAVGVTVPPAAIAIIPILDSVAAFLVALASTTDELLADVISDDFHRDFVCAFSNASFLQDVLDIPYSAEFGWVNGVTRQAMNITLATVGRLAWLGRGGGGDEYVALDALPSCPFVDCDDWTIIAETAYVNGSGWGWTHTPASPIYTGIGWIGDAGSLRPVAFPCFVRFAHWEALGSSIRVNVSGHVLSSTTSLFIVVWDGVDRREVEIPGTDSAGDFLFEVVIHSQNVASMAIGLGSYVVPQDCELASLQLSIESDLL